MPFTGKATFSAGVNLPEIAEDVADIIGIVSPRHTPLLDHLGDPRRSATSTVHEWLQDALLPNSDTISDASIAAPTSETAFDVAHGQRFRIGDQIRQANAGEVMLVTNVAANTLTVIRGYGSTTPAALSDGATLTILGNAALEGADRPGTRFTTRTRHANYTQIFTAGVEVSGTQAAVNTIGVNEELDHQKSQRLTELLRDLENCVINGVAPASDGQGSASVRRTMKGIIPFLTTNVFRPGVTGFPQGDGTGNDELTEAQVNAALRSIWEQSAGSVDTLVVNGVQKRRINGFIAAGQRFFGSGERFKDAVSVYESDFGVCRVLLSRWVPSDAVLLLDSSRVDVLPLNGRSFHYKPQATDGDRDAGQLIGEYTLELRNENAHGLIRGLGV